MLHLFMGNVGPRIFSIRDFYIKGDLDCAEYLHEKQSQVSSGLTHGGASPLIAMITLRQTGIGRKGVIITRPPTGLNG